MARDLTGKNLDTLKDGNMDVAVLADINGHQIEDAFTDTGGFLIPMGEHRPINLNGNQGTPDHVIWREDATNTLAVDPTSDQVIHDNALTKVRKGAVMDVGTPDGLIRVFCKTWKSGSDHAFVGPMFRMSGIDGSGYAVSLVSDEIKLWRNDAGSLTEVDSASLTLASATTVLIVVRLDGSTIEVMVNHAVYITYTATKYLYNTWCGLWLDWAGTPSDAQVANATADFFSVDTTFRVADRLYSMIPDDWLYDTFTESIDTSLETHSPDASVPGSVWNFDTGANMDIVAASDVVYSNATGSLDGHIIEAHLADGVVQVEVVPWDDGVNFAYIHGRFRYDGVNGSGWAFGVKSVANKIVLIKQTSSASSSEVASADEAITSGQKYTIKAVFTGNNIQVYLDGVLMITHTDSFNQTETKVGMLAHNNTITQSCYAENFYAGMLLPYKSLIPTNYIGEIDRSGPGFGGLASISDTVITLVNQGLWSSRFEATGFLKGRQVSIMIIAVTGKEAASDREPRFTGHIERVINWSLEEVALRAETPIEKDLIPFPRDIVDLGVDANAPINSHEAAIPVVVGNINNSVAPLGIGGSGERGYIVAPLHLIDIFERRYVISGDNNTLSGSAGAPYSPIWLDKESGVWSSSDSASGFPLAVGSDGRRGISIDTNDRIAHMFPIYDASGNTFTSDWHNVADGKDASFVTLDDGADKLVVRMQAVRALGVITGSIRVKIALNQDQNQALRIRILKGATVKMDENSETGTGNQTWDSDNEISPLLITDWSDWSFGDMTIELTRNSGTIKVYHVRLEVKYQAVEEADQDSNTIFGISTGYQDKAARYQDGSVISSDGELLRNPSKLLQAFLRDRFVGFGLMAARLRASAFTAAASATSSRYMDFVLLEFTRTVEGSRSWVNNFVRRAGLAAWPDVENVWTVDALDKTKDPIAFFCQAHHIAVDNPGAHASSHVDAIAAGEPGPIYNEYTLLYGWSDALETFTQQKVATGRYRIAGVNGSTNASPGTTFTAAGQTFEDDNILAGYIIYIRSGAGATVGIYTISSVDSQTQLTLATSPGNSLSGLEFYIGPNLNATCVDSYLEYGDIHAYPEEDSELREIHDTATVDAILDDLVAYYAFEKLPIELETFFNAVHVEYRDFVFINHPILPPGGAPQDNGWTVAAAIVETTTNTTIQVNDASGAFSVGDWLLIDNELVKVTGTWSPADPQLVDVDRAQLGSFVSSHAVNAQVLKMTTKWEVLSVRDRLHHHNPISLEVREV